MTGRYGPGNSLERHVAESHPVPLRVHRETASDEDRLFDLLADGQRRQEGLLKDIGDKLDRVTDACGGMREEIRALQVTPRLIRLLVVGMAACVLLVGIAAGAQVVVSTGWLEAATIPTGTVQP